MVTIKHLGDITKISGYSAPIVDCIIGGSPCQDLSVAGKRAGLDGERSGLYIEQVRIVKEMRERDRRSGRSGVDIRPRYMVWENVPGAFSSNKGDDFRIVLEEIAKVCDKDAVIPMPDKGKWTTSGAIVADGWSVAWRVLDAQYWGVPQRRRRIALVADFGGQSAPEILFVRKSLSGHSEPSKPKREESSSDASGSLGADDSLGADQYNGVILGDTVSTLGVNCGMSHGRQCVLEPITFQWQAGVESSLCINENASPALSCSRIPSVACHTDVRCYDIGEARLRTPSEYKDLSPTLSARCGTGGNNTPAVITFEPGIASREGGHIYENVCGTLRANAGDNQMATAYTFSKAKRAQTETDYETWKESDTANTLNAFDTGDVRTSEAVVYAVDQGGGKSACDVREGKSPTLTTTHDGAPVIAMNLCGEEKVGTLMARDFKGVGRVDTFDRVVCQAVDCRNATEDTVNGALQSNAAHSLNGNNVVRTRYIVRRLTPLECERLQGYPDGWTDIGDYIDSTGKKRQTSDAARYKALGNSIALPPWKFVLKKLCACYERDATMASLFDGIGGFPYLWEQLNGKGSCLWASEIEEFPMAVTKVRIGE